jgi:hypothetical protein
LALLQIGAMVAEPRWCSFDFSMIAIAEYAAMKIHEH